MKNKNCSARWVAAVGGWLALSASSIACTRKEPEAAPAAPPVQPPEPAAAPEPRAPRVETPIRPEEAQARGRFVDLMSSKKFRVLPVPGMTRDEAEKALTAAVAGLDPKLAAAAKVDKTYCLQNGCMMDVVFSDWSAFQQFNDAVVDAPASPFNQYKGARFQSGRSPREGGGFVVSYGLMFPVDKTLAAQAGNGGKK